ncbi:MAG: spore protease YyaC [Clostridia bacterium]
MTSVFYNSEGATEALAKTVLAELPREAVYLCIGTAKVVSDSLGPIIGTKLIEKMKRPVFVYGLANANITAINLERAYELIKQIHPDRKIVVIDSAVGDLEQVGEIQLSDGGIVPGAATNKNLSKIGDKNIVGIVSEKGLGDFYATTSNKIALVEKMAELISSAIAQAYS